MELSKRQMTILGIVVFAIAFYFLFLKEEDVEESGYSLFRKPPKKKPTRPNVGPPCDKDPGCIDMIK